MTLGTRQGLIYPSDRSKAGLPPHHACSSCRPANYHSPTRSLVTMTAKMLPTRQPVSHGQRTPMASALQMLQNKVTRQGAAVGRRPRSFFAVLGGLLFFTLCLLAVLPSQQQPGVPGADTDLADRPRGAPTGTGPAAQPGTTPTATTPPATGAGGTPTTEPVAGPDAGPARPPPASSGKPKTGKVYQNRPNAPQATWQPIESWTMLPPGTALPADTRRREEVRNAMKKAWDGYVKYAWGKDELMPVSKKPFDWLHQGSTITDAMDTLWIMGLKDEFAKALEWVRTELSWDKNQNVSLFETTIRSLGGLLAAYDLSGEQVLLDKAEDLALRMMPAFETPSGIPKSSINLKSGKSSLPSWTGGSAILSEVGTIQLEFKYLSQKTGNSKFGEKVESVVSTLEQNQKPHGLYPLYVSTRDGTFKRQQVSLGALGDSWYEYLLKQWHQTGKTVPKYRDMYDETIKAVMDRLVLTSTPSGYTYIAEWNGKVVHKMDHLVCFAGGMFAFGALDLPAGSEEQQHQFDVGAELTRTCYETYRQMATGLAPEYVNFPDRDPNTDFVAGARHMLLRPETVESLFYLWRLTGDQRFRTWAWDIFKAIRLHCETPDGFSGLRDVTKNPPVKDDKMQSFFLAETLKYLFLIFDDSSNIPLDQYTFNTEAHPLKNFNVDPSPAKKNAFAVDSLPW